MVKENNFIVVLGGGIDLKGNLPAHQLERLEKAIELFQTIPNCKIILSGKFSFLFEEKKPPLTEAKAMKNYLLDKDIHEENIILEEESMDTIGNIFYIKKDILRDIKYHKIIFITSKFHIERVEYIVGKFFDPENIEFIGTEDTESGKKEEKIVERQKELLVKTQKYLGDMKHGDLEFLDKKIYRDWYYTEARPDWVKQFVAKGK